MSSVRLCGEFILACTYFPVTRNKEVEVFYEHSDTMKRYHADVEGEQHKIFLVIFSHTIVHPWTVVVHLLYTCKKPK